MQNKTNIFNVCLFPSVTTVSCYNEVRKQFISNFKKSSSERMLICFSPLKQRGPKMPILVSQQVLLSIH